VIDLDLDVYASTVLDGSGNGIAFVGPTVVREHWTVTNVAVSATTAVLDAACNVYLGTSPIAAQLLLSTTTGSSGDSSGGSQDMQPGQQIIAQWKGGDVGATATLHVNGKRRRPNNGS
jgi:hypothetical protein